MVSQKMFENLGWTETESQYSILLFMKKDSELFLFET